MISEPTRSQLQALINVSRLPEWREVAGFLEAELQAATDVLVSHRDADVLRNHQGRAGLLREFKQLVADAPALLDKAKR